jgi:putative ABC transport system ATP-binding protein
MIEVEHAVKTFHRGSQEIRALDDVSFAVAPAETLAIQGPSGSGKTTLLTLIGTLDEPTSGCVRLDGTDPWTLSDRKRSRMRAEQIGFVFQSYNLIPQLSAWKNVALPLRYAGARRRERKHRAIQALEDVGLADRIHHLPSQLSGGEEQRVAVARAMVASPSLLLADEPTGNLDSRAGSDVISLLEELWENHGKTIIMVTHDLNLAKRARRKIQLKDGEIMRGGD